MRKMRMTGCSSRHRTQKGNALTSFSSACSVSPCSLWVVLYDAVIVKTRHRRILSVARGTLPPSFQSNCASFCIWRAEESSSTFSCNVTVVARDGLVSSLDWNVMILSCRTSRRNRRLLVFRNGRPSRYASKVPQNKHENRLLFPSSQSTKRSAVGTVHIGLL